MTDNSPFTGSPEEFVLGETRGEHRLEQPWETVDAALALVRQARRAVRIFSHNLDAPLYATSDFTQAVSEFARRSPHTFVRILVRDPTPAIRQHHPLVDMIRVLSSHIEARRTAAEWIDEPFAFLVADDHGLLYRPYGDRFEGIVDFAAGAGAVERRRWFDYVWEQSQPEPEFRRLSV